MSHIIIDPDEWETVVESGGTLPWSGSLSVSQRRRSPEDVARIKTKRLEEQEAEILRQADAIRARRRAQGL